MDKKIFYNTLELDKVLAKLAEEACCEDGAAAALSLKPCGDFDEVSRLLKQTDDAHMLMARYATPSFGKLKNVNSSLKRAAAGASLSIAELMAIGETLRSFRSLTEWKERAGELGKTSIDGYFSSITPNKFMEDRINSVIISEDEISDNASPELARIRRHLRAATQGIRDKLDKMIRSSEYQKYLMEPVVTIRGGRFVVPVKLEQRSNVPGLVHDTSASGATVFIEPASVVEANNDIKVLHSKEKAEIDRIIAELSAQAGSFSESIGYSYESAVSLDLIFAKARLAYNMKASVPEINDRGIIDLKSARHPLIDPKRVVPIDISLGESFDSLIITGPNTGGKTVTLKTLGLLTLMAMCGLMIPVREHSKISVFSNVMADIGDEQSIEQSLSTFSSHISNIINILNFADDRSLVLLDELGAGTDPVEGAALAVAIIESFRSRDVRLAATTHYAELKAYALETCGVENASCEFDVNSLRPTYRLLIGVPGRSNAFAISERLGLPDTIVSRAKALVSEESRNFENVVSSLEKARQEAAEERDASSAIKAQLESMKKAALENEEKLRAERDKIIEKARQEAKRITEKASLSASHMLGELEDMKKQANSGGDLNELARRAKQSMKSGMKALESAADIADSDDGYVLPRPLKAGDTVKLNDINKKATVQSQADANGYISVLVGNIKMKVPLSNLRLVQSEKSKPKTTLTRSTTSRAERKVSAELDLRGQTAEEGIMELDRFIDSAVLSGIDVITAIHGKGTGVLRKAVHSHLKGHKNVRSFRLGVFGEGESGVTIIELK